MGIGFVEFRQLQEVGVFSYSVYFWSKSHSHDMRERKMVAKEISRKIFRRIALESCPTVHIGEAHDCSGELPNNSPRRVV